ncbi:hypothetical protein BC936DRAFT_136899 [Jimgerdemannia flammicorona]|uniref:NYN domain-containing protein n=1 Tax=Jimgerdemannia flammicorona TaxID=994334 RepID=A0A433CYJ2_9FUNG|nr:hypothetical protein BC936DRAFT_136899 [Jimgerdemannia flammicorona]
MATEEENVILYIDNSNIFINAGQHAAHILKFRPGVPTDTRCRIDLSRMVAVACRGRKALRSKLYGSEPPLLSTVWDAIRDKDIDVSHFKRSSWNSREKEIDTTLTADAVDDLGELKEKAGPNRVMILFSGDKDMLPILHKAQKHGWRVEIWSFRSALANEMKNAYPDDMVSIHYIDDCFEYVRFTESRWDVKRSGVPADRTMILRFDTSKFEKNNPDWILNKVVEFTSQLFRLPTMACWHDLDHTSPAAKTLLHLALICVPPERRETNARPLYDFATLYKHKDMIHDKFLSMGCILVQTFQQYSEGIEINGFEPLKDSEKIPQEPFATSGVGWTVVAPEKRRPAQWYTSMCKHGYRCMLGKACHFGHTPEQRAYFKLVPDGSKRRFYKIKLCLHANACHHKARPYLCSYAHGLVEASCLNCDIVGEHWTDECPAQLK